VAGGEIFVESSRGRRPSINDEEICYIMSSSGRVEEMPFTEAKNDIGNGMGLLIVTIDGRKFYAETEYHQGFPTKTYSGG
jgi:hypothetical protein